MRAPRAPGAPGTAPRWGPGRKHAFGGAPGSRSHVWFTVARGNLSEVFYPSVDRPLLQGLRFLVAAPGTPPIDDAADAEHQVRWYEPGVPSFEAQSRHTEYSLTTEFIPDPQAEALILSGMFRPELPDVRLYLQATLHDVVDGVVIEREPPALAARQGQAWVVVLGPFRRCSVGYLNSSDLFVELHDNDGVMEAEYTSALRGHVALGGELGVAGGPFQVALGFGTSRDAAEEAAQAALARGATAVRESLSRAWRTQPSPDRNVLKVAGDGGALVLASMTVLHCLEDKQRPGAFIAAPTAPWGDSSQPYSVVCNRDLFHIATALLDAGDHEAARRALDYLESTQREDGSWPLRYRVTGASLAEGVALDQVALPILLAWRLGVVGALQRDPYPRLVRRAAGFLVGRGPATELDRWMDAGGYSPSTLAVAIAALIAAAEFADDAREPVAAEHLRAVADYWNSQVERWTYLQAERRYVRLADPEGGPSADDPVGVEFLDLVRRGLRRHDDPNILSSLRAADSALEVTLPNGFAWLRFAADSHGETDDGQAPWSADRPGRGHPWPLLIGERAHHALMAGDQVSDHVSWIESCAGPERLLPEQVWDGPSLPQRGLEPGCPTGSAAPLGWAHAEYLRLVTAYAGSRLPDLVEPVRRRYGDGPGQAPLFVWSHAHRIRSLPPGRRLRVQLRQRGTVLWSTDAWATSHVVQARDTGLGCWVADLPAEDVPVDGLVEWTANYADGRWEGGNYRLRVAGQEDMQSSDGRLADPAGTELEPAGAEGEPVRRGAGPAAPEHGRDTEPAEG